MTPPRRIAIAIATLTLAGLTTACGAIGTAVDCNKVASEVTTIMNGFSTSVAGAATDPSAMEKAGQEAAGKIKTLAADYDGELRSALDEMASGMESIKIDAANPTAAMDAVTKLQSSATKIQGACS
ncbi:hypothetical protein ACBI99_00530 [Nonomuraea sp. ATR24]|uniref:hypothetical protein n=1 Tax=Nonomuraea TaxID=83681 RepID=UPI001C5F6D51|nr:hypothetical protein [Nonomuraea ceibae]